MRAMDAAPQAHASLSGASMGTTWSASFLNPGLAPEQLQGRMQDALDAIVAQMSTWDPDSAISRLNRAEPGWYQLAPAFFQVLAQALELAAASEGAYDPTVGALVDLWGFGPPGPVSVPPRGAAVDAALARSGWQRTAISAEHRAAWQPGGLQFDLSSIAKGYGVDEMARVLADAGVRHYLVELGGELKASGLNPTGRPWEVDVESPGLGPDRLPVRLCNAAIATSGHYRRYFTHQSRRYAHTVDPRSGMPLPDDLVSVTVIHPQCMMADGLATALLALGPEEGPAHARRNEIAALFMTKQGGDFAVEWTDPFADLAGAHTALPCL